jgi:hypothetical protein
MSSPPLATALLTTVYGSHDADGVTREEAK